MGRWPSFDSYEAYKDFLAEKPGDSVLAPRKQPEPTVEQIKEATDNLIETLREFEGNE